MVLGLIDFLLGGKKKTKVPKNAQISSPGNNANVAFQSSNAATVPNGADNVTANAAPNNNEGNNNALKFEDASKPEDNKQVPLQNDPNPQGNAQSPTDNMGSTGAPKKISEVINRIYKELKSTNENVAQISTDIKELQGNVSSLDHRVSELETKDKTVEEKLTDIDDNMSKFLSLYELVNNQYNPFVSQEDAPKKVVINANGNSEAELSPEEAKEKIKNLDVSNYKPETPKEPVEDLKAKLLELDTLDIESAAADAVPLTNIKSNTNSLVIILSWLEYLVKKVGVEEAKNALRYYTETLKWITPEVYFDLEKFLRGMEDATTPKSKVLSVKDHIVSLYFISKLNEKNLDSRLTSAVLQIIKEE